MSDKTQTPTAGQLRDMGMLDLRSAKTEADFEGITSIANIGVILVPQHLATALAKVPMSGVGGIVPVPPESNLNLITGQVRLTGEALAAGNPENILMIVGQVFITTPVQSVGYKEIQVFGQLFAPRGSEAALGAKIGQLNGQNFYLPTNPRIFMGESEISAEFLQFLPERSAFVVMGALRFTDDVTVALVQEKISEIVLMGEIQAPKALVALLEVLTPEKMGEIRATKA